MMSISVCLTTNERLQLQYSADTTAPTVPTYLQGHPRSLAPSKPPAGKSTPHQILTKAMNGPMFPLPPVAIDAIEGRENPAILDPRGKTTTTTSTMMCAAGRAALAKGCPGL
ncbi:hypothetical protein F66182_10281 [Fusarium sp. NRRL 66182]|nr:hypothetical protein F66182_10281 [Fusarium sp. NRRL 66182]